MKAHVAHSISLLYNTTFMDTGLFLLNYPYFIDDLTREFSSGPLEVELIFYRFTYQNVNVRLLPLFKKMLQDGTKLKISVDGMYSRYVLLDTLYIPLSPSKRDPEKRLQEFTNKMFDELEEMGATIRYNNKPGLFSKYVLPFTGRDHRKLITIVRKDGSKVAYFGAMNLDGGARNDYMVKATHPAIVDGLFKLARFNDTNMPLEDMSLKVTPFCTLYFDRGAKFKSVIYDRALEIIGTTRNDIIIVTQLPPEPKLVKALIAATRERNIRAEILLPDANHKNINGSLINRVTYKKLIKSIEGTKVTVTHSTKGFVHAKMLQTGNITIATSNNFIYAGVMFGTVEIGAEIRDNDFAAAAKAFIDEIR